LVRFYGKSHRLRRDGVATGDGQTQRILHRVLAVPGRQLQNLQVFANAFTRTLIATQPVVGDAKVAGWKHVFPILIVLEGPGLAD
jgi:hypothetical protein